MKNTDVTNLLVYPASNSTCAVCGKPYKFFKPDNAVNIKGVWIPDCFCNDNKDYRKERFYKVRDSYKDANFPPILHGERLRKLTCEHKEEAELYVMRFRPKRLMGFHFVGTVGNGKTTLAVCIGKELVRKGYTVRFMTFAQCMRILQSAYSPRSRYSFDEQLQAFLKIDLLILDDFGRDGYKEQKLADAFELLNALYNAKCNVILTSNPEMIEKVKAIPDFHAMLDRFRKLAKYRAFVNPSYRLKGF